MAPRSVIAAVVLGFVFLLDALPALAAPPVEDFSVRTVPAVPGYPMTLDGHTEVADSQGVAHFKTRDAHRSLTGRVDLNEHFMMVDGKRARVVGSRIFGRDTLALDIFWPVRFNYIDLNGGQVDVAEIESVRLKSVTGETREVKAQGEYWLQGSRVVPLSGGLENKKLLWTIQSVDYASANVVNSAQQRFKPAEQQDVTVKLLFYRTQVKVTDAFFGFPVGKSVALTYPDQTVGSFALPDNGVVALPSVPRGNYTIVADGPGPRMSRPVAISRDQELDLKFYSWLDIALVILLGAAFGFGTLWVGWRRRRAHRRNLSMGPARAAPWSLGWGLSRVGTTWKLTRPTLRRRPVAVPRRSVSEPKPASGGSVPWSWWRETDGLIDRSAATAQKTWSWWDTTDQSVRSAASAGRPSSAAGLRTTTRERSRELAMDSGRQE